ncbi:MAG: hypothetical protein U0Q22_11635 [Acidimicrobiales bacterium]
MRTVEYSRLSERHGEWVEARSRRIEAALYGIAVLAALATASVQDDAFISFRYARNLSQGHGLVFNAGERVEGYTNFLWTWLMSVPERFGWSSAGFSIAITVPLMVVTLALALRFARKVLGNETLALLAGAALVANMTFIGYGTSGLETMLQAMLVTGVALALVPYAGDPSALGRVVAGVLGGLAILTRIDSSVVVGAWCLVHLWWLWRRRGEPVAKVVLAAVQIGVPMVAVVAPWLVWKHGYYDALFPNTLQAKAWSNHWVPFLFGIGYLLGFFAAYAAFVLIGRWRRARGTFPAAHAWALAAVVVAWFLYICWVGADFMEFRFMMPVLPILVLVAAWLLDHYRTPRRQVGLAAFLLFVSALHAVLIIPFPVFSFQELKHWPDDNPNSWQAFGEMLHREFPGGVAAPGQPVMAIIPAGVVPYYAQLPMVDMLGLNDRETAVHGLDYPFYFPGHVRTSTIAYLERRHVSIILGSMRDTLVDPARTSYHLSEVLDIYPAGDLRNLPSTAKLLEIPTGTPGRAWRFISLQRDTKVDAAIAKHRWRLLPIDRRCDTANMDFLTRTFGQRGCPT